MCCRRIAISAPTLSNELTVSWQTGWEAQYVMRFKVRLFQKGHMDAMLVNLTDSGCGDHQCLSRPVTELFRFISYGVLPYSAVKGMKLLRATGRGIAWSV